MVISLVTDFGELVKMVLKRGGGKSGEWVGKELWGLLGLWPLCVFGYIFVVEGACVRDCRRLGLCKVGTVG
jgi:hypothetical protein